MLSQELPERVAGARSMREAFELLKSVPSIGDFLAYQYVTDLNYSTASNFGETGLSSRVQALGMEFESASRRWED